jgi:hypothetical protein
MKLSHPKLTVIEGGGKKPPSWREVPSRIIGRSPFNKDEITSYRIAVDDIRKGLAANRKQPLLDLWSAGLGELPPFPNIQRYASEFGATRTALIDARACFRGLKRPLGDDDTGYDIVAFVSKPTKIFVFDPTSACLVNIKSVPYDLVFVVYVRLDFPERRTYQRAGNAPAFSGMVVSWEFVESDAEDPTLPSGHKDRYRRRLW